MSFNVPCVYFSATVANSHSWLYYKWWKGENAILADEMGLGKTIQIISFLSLLHQEHKIWPFLIVVPHSTVPNWKREIKLWNPSLRVVAYYGSKESRRLSVGFDKPTEINIMLSSLHYRDNTKCFTQEAEILSAIL